MLAPNSDIESVLQLGKGASRTGRMGKWALRVVLPVALVGLGLWWYGAGSSTTAVSYETEPAARGSITVAVTATGTVEPTNQVQVGSELSGIVRTVEVDYNDTVSLGQVLARLDTDKLLSEVEHSRATLASQQAKVDEAAATVRETESEVARIRPLQLRDFASRQDLDVAEAAHERARAALESARALVQVAQADLSIKETDLAKAVIVSPIDGIVLERNIDPGQTVAASFTAPVLFVIAEDLRAMELEVDIDEADVGSVAVGQSAVFRVEAYRDRQFPAEITQVRYASETVAGVVTYKAILSIDNADLALRPGMTATADVTVQHVEDALLVPNAALRLVLPDTDAEAEGSRGLLQMILPHRPSRTDEARNGAASQGDVVWILKDGEPVSVAVKTGASDGRRTEIVSGDLAVGDAVITDAVTEQ